MLSATSDVQVDTPEVRVTEWRLAPGSATGHHTHGMDYVIVPVTAGEMTIVAPNGERSKAQLGVGNLISGKPGSSTMCLMKRKVRSCSLRSS
jgi:beta-alanine degradation protein BauB